MRIGQMMFGAGTVACFMMVLALPLAGAQMVTVPAGVVDYPDLIVHNGKIVTMDDPSFEPTTGHVVQAMAVRDGKVLALGSDADILALAGPQTEKLDLKGRTVVPGMINTHTHVHDHFIRQWSRQHTDEIEQVRRTFSVTGVDYAELTKGIEVVIKERMANPQPDQWAIINLPTGGSSGTGIGVKYLNDGGMTFDRLNELAPNTPVYLLAHPAWMLNTAAQKSFLTLYGLDYEPKNLEALSMDTTISRSLVVDRYFANHIDDMADLFEDGLDHMAALGLTSYSSHIVGLRIWDGYMKLVRERRMPIRFYYSHRFAQQVEPDMAGFFMRLGDMAGLGDDYFRQVGVTLGGLDSGPPSICTTMDAPEEYKSKEQCILEPGDDYDKAIAAALNSHERYVVNHVYGDKAMDYFMDAVDRVIEHNPAITLDYIRSRRLTADHCGFYPRQEQLARIKKLGMVISCDPRFLDRSYPWLAVYGEDKADRIAPAKSLIDAGIMVTGEGELPAETGTSPTYLAYESHFLTRKNSRGQSVAPGEAVDRVTLMKMLTTWPSYYVMDEDRVGSLEPGKLADFLVLNKDYFAVPEGEISTIFPLATVVGGKIVILRKELAPEWKMEPIGPQLEWKFATEFSTEE